jgi:hypothetical protein
MRLQDVKTFYISPDNERYQARRAHMEQLLKDAGFTDVTHKKTAGRGANVDLIDATVEILESVADDTPVLILEDDVNVNVDGNMNHPPCGCPDISHSHGRVPNDICIPHGADAVYLGISKRGGSFYNGFDDGPCITEPYNAELVRVKNMLSTHAILYISARYKADVAERLRGISGLANYFSDVVISRLHRYYNIYAYKRPLFYQWAAYGGQEADTRFVLE